MQDNRIAQRLAGVAPLTESRDRSVRGDPRRFTQVVPLGQRCPELPRDVADVVSRMMHVDPLERYQTASDAKHALETLIARQGSGAGGPSGSSGPAGVRTRVRPWRRSQVPLGGSQDIAGG